ncbi:MAG: hypothetical protein PF484_10590 [Bacteroidales bacterium]|jgi:hypothetical protein|nr:hypothetical protein [Bacteroidales bacterium]
MSSNKNKPNQRENPRSNAIVFPNGTAFFKDTKSAVLFASSKDMFALPDADPISVDVKNKPYKVVPWGEDNDLPQQIIEKVGKSPDMSTGLLFNINVGFGEGITPCRISVNEAGKKVVTPVFDNKEINLFFEQNDINGYFLEQLTDLNYFFNTFPEIILNQDSSQSRKIVELNSKEASFSRWSEMNSDGAIENHLYSAKWTERSFEDGDIVQTPVLHRKRPIIDLLRRIGREKQLNGKTTDEKKYRYIVPVNMPTPGRFYYQKPYWFSIIESGWYDFATFIPEFKKYLIQNGMTIKYIIYIADDYFPDIFTREGITDEVKQTARIKKEYADLNKYTTGISNSGKSMISFYKQSPDGKKQYRIEITAVENQFKGGEYLDDSAEVSNMIAYTLGVHPSLIGAVPGGSKGGFSGSDKRELFIIKQALMKPMVDRLLRPLYLIKAINKWPEDIHFTVPHITLTTLDKNKTGSETQTD